MVTDQELVDEALDEWWYCKLTQGGREIGFQHDDPNADYGPDYFNPNDFTIGDAY